MTTRPRCVVIFASEDSALAGKLADALTELGFDGWSSHKIAQGRWNVVLDDELATCDAVVPLVSRHTRTKGIFHDEWRTAEINGKPIFPFAIDPDGAPLGLGQFSRTDAGGWDGSIHHPAIEVLHQRLRQHFGAVPPSTRHTAIDLGGKRLELPAFVFSLSSFETQLDPQDGLELISGLAPLATLVSAYDMHEYLERPPRGFKRSIESIAKSRTVLFLDSGNYEATRKGDHRSNRNPGGWCREKFWDVASTLPAEIVFSYDPPLAVGKVESLDSTVGNIVDRYIRDLMHTGLASETLAPIVHVPTGFQASPDIAAALVYETVKALHPTLVAIPERELGDGLRARMRAVMTIRRKLNELGRYQPLHILGTGNPISIAALAASGADSFDGLEWCRTAANYETNSLMHIQQFDCLIAAFGSRMRNGDARALAELAAAQFQLRVASYNYDYFEGWMRTVQKSTRAGGAEELLRFIPAIGASLADELIAGEPA